MQLLNVKIDELAVTSINVLFRIKKFVNMFKYITFESDTIFLAINPEMFKKLGLYEVMKRPLPFGE